MIHPRSVALIIPTYKNESTVVETLRSLQGQKDLSLLSAIIVSDDCSPDRTREVARANAPAGVPFILVESGKNTGEAKNMMRAIEHLPAGVEWILILHGDDYAKPGWISAMVREVSKADPAVSTISCSYDYLLPDGTITPSRARKSFSDGPEISRGIGALGYTLLHGCWWHISGCAFRVSDYVKLGGRSPRLPHYGDWDLILRVYETGNSVGYLDFSLTVYRESAGSISSQSRATLRDVQEQLFILRRFRKYLSLSERLFIYRRLFGGCLRSTTRDILAGRWSYLPTKVFTSTAVVGETITGFLVSRSTQEFTETPRADLKKSA